MRIPLGGDRDALAIIARACRSRLFAYFFAFPAQQTPAPDDLRALSAQDAIGMMLVGGSPIERGRWHLIATSLAFDENAWPFPVFASRGAFGDAWTQVRYDPQTLQIVERQPTPADAARALADARFADAPQAEEALRRLLADAAEPAAHRICELRSPIDAARLRAVEEGGTIQFSTQVNPADVQALQAFFEAHPHVRLRVHGFRRGFDARRIAGLTALRELTLDVHELQHPQALSQMRSLRMLRVGSMQTDLAFLEALPDLQTLELRGTRANVAPVERCRGLEALLLENTPPLDFSRCVSANTLQRLTLSHGQYDVSALTALSQLRGLELRALEVARLPNLAAFEHLQSLVLVDLHELSDLSPIAQARSLRELRISGMPHLNVGDFEPLRRCAALEDAHIDVGSRRKEREIYRLLEQSGQAKGEGRSGPRGSGT